MYFFVNKKNYLTTILKLARESCDERSQCIFSLIRKITSQPSSNSHLYLELCASEILKVRSEYCISLVIRQRFFPSENNPKDLDPSSKMDLDLWDC